MTHPGPSLEAAAAAAYAVLREHALVDAHDKFTRAVVTRLLPAEFEQLPRERADHYRRVASAAVEAHAFHLALHDDDRST